MDLKKKSIKESSKDEIPKTVASQPQPKTTTKSRKKTKAKKNKKFKPGFTTDNISSNAVARNLIRDLVNCYTDTMNLPPDSLNSLRTQFYNRTMAVFSSALNACVDRIFKKLLASNYFRILILGRQVTKCDASCQTDISHDNSLERPS